MSKETRQGKKKILNYLERKHNIFIGIRTFDRYRKKCKIKCFGITDRLITTTGEIDKWVKKLKNYKKRNILSPNTIHKKTMD